MTMYLIIGNCGVGKTWIMKSLIKALGISKVYSYKTGLYQYLKQKDVIILGKYDDTVFEGSDRLSMAIMTDNAKIKPIFESVKYVIGEGDRFTNSSFITEFNPVILKVLGDGSEGRIKRGSGQSERHLKSIATRVNNIQANIEFNNSADCLAYLTNEILTGIGEKAGVLMPWQE